MNLLKVVARAITGHHLSVGRPSPRSGDYRPTQHHVHHDDCPCWVAESIDIF